jgi:hypothetical protein
MGKDFVAVLLAPSGFSERLISWNGLLEAGFAAWEFLPGMRFSERAAWWRGGGDRGGAHEGLDICWYRTVDGRRLSLGAGACVPVIYAGEVVSVVDDFLGASVFVAHAHRAAGGRRLHTIYGHIAPASGLAPGSRLVDGAAVGVIAETSGRNVPVPPHVHISLALVAGGQLSGTRLDWASLRDPARATLLDPMPIMSGVARERRVPNAPPRG